MFSNRTQSIPQCFKDKMLLDKRWDHLTSLPIIPFALTRRIKLLRDTARYKCMQNVAKKIGTDGVAG